MNNNINISLSQNEVQALIQLIDISVKSQGLSVAETAVVLIKKIQDSVKQTGVNTQSEPVDFTVVDQ
jgi:hypothetical protein